MSKHTPTPWENNRGRINGPDREVCRVMGHDDTDWDNADFIVRAVNAHEDLVEALKLCTTSVGVDTQRIIKAALAKARGAGSEDE